MALINDTHGRIGTAMIILAVGLALGILIVSFGASLALKRSYVQYSNQSASE